MRRNIKKPLAACVLAAICAANAQAKTLTIGIDLSGSNPLLTHKHFAAVAARYVADQITLLDDGDKVRITSFGARNEAENVLSKQVVISRKNRVKKVAKQVSSILQQLPSQAKEGQSETNIVAWLEFTNGFDCEDKSTVLVITDGIEHSSYTDGQSFAQGKKTLPEPDVDLKGCKLIFYGLGAGLEPVMVKHIRKSWRSYAEKAGTTLTAVIP